MIGMAKGMANTLRHLFRPAFTEAYPWKPVDLPPASRMSFELQTGKDGLPLCKVCMLCERSCPDGAITITSTKREDGPGRVLDRFEIDFGVCMHCGICVENCTTSGLMFTGDFEHAVHERSDTVIVLWDAAGHPPAVLEPATAAELRELPVEPSPAGPQGGPPSP
jgi:NADH-quinone oxidoreductase subunit I